MSLSRLLPRRFFHRCEIEIWGRSLTSGDLAPPDLPAGLEVGRVTDRDPPAAPRRRRLVEAMAPTPQAEIDDRLASGRRAYAVEGPSGVVAYAWVTRGDEQIAEVEGRIRVGPGEAYIWDCATLPAFRGRGLYPALLRAMARDLAAEGVGWVWIAARSDNLPSLRGFEKAGYVRVAGVRYRRLWRWRRLRVRADAAARPPLVREAPRVVASSAGAAPARRHGPCESPRQADGGSHMRAPESRELPVNVFETDEEVVVVAPMPGIEPEDITVRLDGDTLRLESGVRGEDARKRYLHHEWSYGPYRRAVRLPTPVDGEAANVTFGNGVLTVVLPRASVFVPASLDVPKTGLARGTREGHSGGGVSGIGPPAGPQRRQAPPAAP